MHPTVDELQRHLEAELTANADPKRAVGEKKYLKSDLDFIGCSVPVIRTICKELHRSHPDLPRSTVVTLVDRLWDTRVHELRSVGIGVLANEGPKLRASDMTLLESMVLRANTWAHVDWLAITVAGDLVRRFAGPRKRLSRWARHDWMWLRRSALLALLEDLRAGEGDFEAFERFAIPMLEEQEFFIRKAIGWVLREVARKRPQLTADFVRTHRDRMSGLSKREALKHFSKRDQTRISSGR